MTEYSEKDLKRKIKEELHKKLKIDISKIIFEDTDEDDVAHVTVFVKKSKKAIKKDIVYHIVVNTVNLLQEEGFKKFPIVLPRVTKGQKLVA